MFPLILTGLKPEERVAITYKAICESNNAVKAEVADQAGAVVTSLHYDLSDLIAFLTAVSQDLYGETPR